RRKPSPRHGAEICDVAALSDSHDCTTPNEKRASRRASSLTNLQGAGGWSRPNIGWSEHRQTECSFAGRLCRQCRIRSTDRGDDGHLTTNQIGGQGWKPIIVPLRPGVFDRHVPALDISGFSEPFTESCHEFCICFG